MFWLKYKKNIFQLHTLIWKSACMYVSLIFQDGRQSEGWQAPQQAWAPLVKSKEPILSYDQSHDTTRNSGYHRPVTMQWSDPLTSGNMWPSTG